MQIVQDALKVTGIPTYALAWRVTAEYQTPPDCYLVYTTRLIESEHYDDKPQYYRVYVYLNMWTQGDPNDNILTVRAAMRDAGFALSDEAVTYDDATDQTLVSWTWEIAQETELHDGD